MSLRARILLPRQTRFNARHPPTQNRPIRDMNLRTISLIATTFFACAVTTVGHAAEDQQNRIRRTVDRAIQPVMANDGIPGMAVGIIDGDRHYVFNYGLASTKTRTPVTSDTVFELGSVS